MDFYKSPEWLKLRYSMFEKFGRQCMACGETEGLFHVDHIKPRSRHPHLALDITNLQILCAACNIGKGSRGHRNFRTARESQQAFYKSVHPRAVGQETLKQANLKRCSSCGGYKEATEFLERGSKKCESCRLDADRRYLAALERHRELRKQVKKY